MKLLVAARLGVIQGPTEFLPVSRSAHLIPARARRHPVVLPGGHHRDDCCVANDVLAECGSARPTIKFFLRFLAGNRLGVFAYYRLALSAATIVWLWRQ